MLFLLMPFLLALIPHTQASEIPPTLLLLEKIENKESFEYQQAAYAAAMDTLSLGKEALASYDSSRALKLLSVGAKILPWRGDIIQLRNTALETYIKITDEFIRTTNCTEINSRIGFLKQVAPDGILKLSNVPESCNPAVIQKTIKNIEMAIIDDYFKEIYSAPEPVKQASLEKANFTDWPSEFDFIVQRNNNFPTRDLEILHLKFFFDYWQNFRFGCYDFKPDYNSTHTLIYSLNGQCAVYNPNTGNLQTNFTKTAKATQSLLELPQAGANIEVSTARRHFRHNFKTSVPLASKFPESTYLKLDDFLVFDIFIRKGPDEIFAGQAGFISSIYYGNSIEKFVFDFKGKEESFKMKNPHSSLAVKTSFAFRGDERDTVKYNFYNKNAVSGFTEIFFKPNPSETYRNYQRNGLSARPEDKMADWVLKPLVDPTVPKVEYITEEAPDCNWVKEVLTSYYKTLNTKELPGLEEFFAEKIDGVGLKNKAMERKDYIDQLTKWSLRFESYLSYVEWESLSTKAIGPDCEAKITTFLTEKSKDGKTLSRVNSKFIFKGDDKKVSHLSSDESKIQ